MAEVGAPSSDLRHLSLDSNVVCSMVLGILYTRESGREEACDKTR